MSKMNKLRIGQIFIAFCALVGLVASLNFVNMPQVSAVAPSPTEPLCYYHPWAKTRQIPGGAGISEMAYYAYRYYEKVACPANDPNSRQPNYFTANRCYITDVNPPVWGAFITQGCGDIRYVTQPTTTAPDQGPPPQANPNYGASRTINCQSENGTFFRVSGTDPNCGPNANQITCGDSGDLILVNEEDNVYGCPENARPTPVSADGTETPQPQEHPERVSCSSDDEDCLNNNPLVNILKWLVRVLGGLVGVIVVAVIIIAGIQYAASAGSPQATAAAKKRIINAIIALIAYAFLFVFFEWLVPGGIF